MTAPLMKYRNEAIEQELGFDWDAYNALSLWQVGKFGYNNPEATKYVSQVRKLQKLDKAFPADWNEFKTEQKNIKIQKAEVKADKVRESQQLTCKKCGSHDLIYIGDDKQKFSGGKAVGGAVVLGLATGGLGLIGGSALGFAGKKGKHNEFLCNNCGHTQKVGK